MQAKLDFDNPTIAGKFQAYPAPLRKKLLSLRKMIFDMAASQGEIGVIEETLKWGQPSYSSRNKSATPIRLGQVKNRPGHIALYVHCQSRVIDMFKEIHASDAGQFEYDGTRALIIDSTAPLPKAALKSFIRLALTYHLTKKQKPN